MTKNALGWEWPNTGQIENDKIIISSLYNKYAGSAGGRIVDDQPIWEKKNWGLPLWNEWQKGEKLTTIDCRGGKLGVKALSLLTLEIKGETLLRLVLQTPASTAKSRARGDADALTSVKENDCHPNYPQGCWGRRVTALKASES